MSASSKLARSLLSTTRTFTAVSRSSRPTFSLNQSQSNLNHNLVRSFRTTATKMGVHNIANKEEFTKTLEANDVVVLDCFATWCGPCKVIAPQVVKFSDTYTSAHFIKLDVDEVPDVAQELGIRAMPTFIVFKGGEKVAEIVGANPQALNAAIAKVTSEKE